MVEKQQSSSAPHIGSNARLRWLLGTAIVVGLVVLGIVWLPSLRTPPGEPLTADLSVYIRSAAGTSSPLRVGEPGAVPVRDGQQLALEVRYNQPAHTCIVWLDASGKAVPLYPWNMDDLQVKSLAQVPTGFRSAKYLLSPMTIGRGWPVGKGQGLETVLLLSSKTPLSADMKLEGLFSEFPPTKLRHREEAAILSWDRGKQVTSELALHRGAEAEVKEADAALLALMAKLGEHFDLIRAVRFAHEGKP